GGDVPERWPVGGRQLEGDQCLGIDVGHRSGQQVGQYPYPMNGLDRQPRGAQQRGGAVGVETPPQLVGRAGPPVRVGQRGGGHVQVAAHRPGQDGGGPVGDQDAGRATGAQRGGQRGDHLGRVVDDLQQAVAQDQVGAGGGGQFGQPVA